MEEQQLKIWMKNFNKEMDNLQISYAAFFIQNRIDCYYSLKLDEEHNNLILEILDVNKLSNEIFHKITDAYLRLKPV